MEYESRWMYWTLNESYNPKGFLVFGTPGVLAGQNYYTQPTDFQQRDQWQKVFLGGVNIDIYKLRQRFHMINFGQKPEIVLRGR